MRSVVRSRRASPRSTAATPSGYVSFLLPALPVTGGEFDYTAPTYNLGATVKVTESTEVYAGFSQGFALPDIEAFTRRAKLSAQCSCSLASPNCLPSGTSVSFASIAPEAQIVNSYELELRGSAGIFRGSLAGFISTSDEGITFDPLTNKISQQKERIYGVEFSGEAAVTDALTLGTTLAWREGEYDSNKDGKIDSHLPNNRIATPFRGLLYGSYR